ncbi:unannotated protein [freshwater metagenome]|uniref:Unannotated protein n=1 Tax=freshwater metagenome TaxID=449393 RepID=A0A6J6YVI0_9ZZZZ
MYDVRTTMSPPIPSPFERNGSYFAVKVSLPSTSGR